jgi:hypothetical protein
MGDNHHSARGLFCLLQDARLFIPVLVLLNSSNALPPCSSEPDPYVKIRALNDGLLLQSALLLPFSEHAIFNLFFRLCSLLGVCPSVCITESALLVMTLEESQMPQKSP